MNTVEQLQFLARFVKLDLDKGVPEWEWLRVQDELSRFLWDAATRPKDGGFAFDAQHDPETNHYPKQKIVSLQKEARRLLPLFVGGDWASAPTTEVEPHVTYELLSGGVFCVHGKFREMFLMQIILLLSNETEMAKVKQCPECGTVFSRVRRQKYCSGPCVDKANKKAWLKTPKGKRYLQKLKKKRRQKHGN